MSKVPIYGNFLTKLNFSFNTGTLNLIQSLKGKILLGEFYNFVINLTNYTEKKGNQRFFLYI